MESASIKLRKKSESLISNDSVDSIKFGKCVICGFDKVAVSVIDFMCIFIFQYFRSRNYDAM